MTPALQAQVDLLIAWCVANTADAADLVNALSQVGLAIGARADQARKDDLTAAKALRAAELLRQGKTPLVVVADADPLIAKLEALDTPKTAPAMGSSVIVVEEKK
jgi:hypothetical protein